MGNAKRCVSFAESSHRNEPKAKITITQDERNLMVNALTALPPDELKAIYLIKRLQRL